VAAVEVEICIEIIGYFQSGLFETGKRAAVWGQFSFERTEGGKAYAPP
jgi:hypothetical protein